MKGRKNKPKALKILEGNPGKRPLNPYEPQPAPVIPSCPKHLRGPARKEWKRITPLLYQLGLLTNLDRAALAAYCQAYGRWVKVEEELKLLDEGHSSRKVLLAISNQAVSQMHKFLVEFGMTPDSRLGKIFPEK